MTSGWVSTARKRGLVELELVDCEFLGLYGSHMTSPARRTCKADSCQNPPVKPGASLCLKHIDEIFISKGLRRTGTYVKAVQPIDAICLRCGERCRPRLADLQNPKRGGCVRCGIERRAASKSLPIEAALREFREAGLKVIGEYVNVNTPVEVLCLVCGTRGRTRLNVLRRGDGGCVPCGTRKANEKKRTPPEQIRRELLAADMEMLGEYINKSQPVRALCLICNRESDIWISTIRSGGRCKHCSYTERGRTFRTDATQVRLELLAAGFQLISPYSNNNTTLELLCLTCGSRADRTWKRFRAGQRLCRTCEPVPPPRPREAEEIVRAEFLDAGLQMIGSYKGSGQPVEAVCIHCGTASSPTLNNLRQGQGGCKTCASQRQGEKLRAPLEGIIALFDARDLDFKGPYINAHTPTAAICRKCKKERTPKPNALLRAGGCRPCGYAVDVPGYLYLIDFNLDGERFRKVGIGRLSSGRIDQHRSIGGIVSQVLHASFVECYEAEQKILDAYKEWAYYPTSARLNGGHTECFLPLTEINLSDWLPNGTSQP